MALLLNAKVDQVLFDQVKNFRESHNLSVSGAVRMLLSLGLSQVDKLDETWRLGALREGQFAGIRRIHAAVKLSVENANSGELPNASEKF